MSKTSSSPASKPVVTRRAASGSAAHRGRWIALGIVAFLALVASAFWTDWYYGLPADAQAQYVGRQTCIECHQPQHDEWVGSHHDLAMDRATDKTVLADFNDAELTHQGITTRMFRRNGQFFVNTEGPDGKLADFEIKYVLGVTPLQQYMVEFDRPADMPEHEVARLQVLRVSWDTLNKRWFHLDPPDVREKLDPSDDLHWTGVAQRWNNMCADCHTTNLQKGYDVATGVYHTTFSEIDVSCETCHGPGSLHVRLAKAPSLFWDRERGYALARLKDPLSNQAEIQTCAHCHSRRRIVQAGAFGGCNYYDYFTNELISPGAYHADGQILDEVYEYSSFLQTKMHAKGVRCTDCHNPHTARLKFEGNQVCTSCHQHPPGKYDAFSHHRHPVGSKGAQCVECHMPQTTYMAVDPRRDHSFRLPRPDLSVKFQSPNACTGCHVRDERLPGSGESGVGGRESEETVDLQSLLSRGDLKEYADWLRAAREGDEAVRQRLAQVDRWADAALDKWYGAARKREPHFTEAIHAAREMTPDAPQKLLELLESRTMPPIARATAALELAAYMEPDDKIQRALEAALADRDPQVRAAAVMTLQQSGDPRMVGVLAPLLNDSSRVMRVEAARGLAQVPDPQLNPEERTAMQRALGELFAGLEVDSDRAGGHLMRGILHQALNQRDEAIEAYETAIRVEPGTTGPRSNLALLYEEEIDNARNRAQQLLQIGDQAAAAKELEAIGALQAEVFRISEEELGLLERDVRFVPTNPAMQGTVGLARYRLGWHKEAEQGLLTAHLLEWRNPLHALRLAVYYRDTGRPERGLEYAAKLRALRPDNPQFEQLEAELRQPALPAP